MNSPFGTWICPGPGIGTWICLDLGKGASGYNETYSHNRCVMRSKNHTIYAFGQTSDDVAHAGQVQDTCREKIFDYTSSNSFFAPGGHVTIKCTRLTNQSKRWSLQEWQALPPANDGARPTQALRPSIAQIMSWGQELLGLPF